MNAKIFLDTNIFVYSFDPSDRIKKDLATELIRQSLKSGTGRISWQVIQEFLNVATQKFATPLRVEDAKTYLHLVLAPLCQIVPNPKLYELCLDIQAETRYSFYDSLILAAAVQGECEKLFTEDLQDGQQVRGVRIVNPFKDL